MAQNYAEDIIETARSYIGAPFRHHFEPNLCDFGLQTIDSCMEAGMDPRGFDCSGLVIASVCQALGIEPHNWNRDYRHLKQLSELHDPEVITPLPGDLIVFAGLGHIAICVPGNRMVHASRFSLSVEEKGWHKSDRLPGVIPIDKLISIAE